jgi:hypothetical protein
MGLDLAELAVPQGGAMKQNDFLVVQYIFNY